MKSLLMRAWKSFMSPNTPPFFEIKYRSHLTKSEKLGLAGGLVPCGLLRKACRVAISGCQLAARLGFWLMSSCMLAMYCLMTDMSWLALTGLASDRSAIAPCSCAECQASNRSSGTGLSAGSSQTSSPPHSRSGPPVTL